MRFRPAEFLKHGDHGYDNKVDTMHALFLAWGPSYKQNYTVAPFQNIELYNFFAGEWLPVSIREGATR